MVIRKASPDTDQAARSLLQKAVRRGNAAVAEATFRYLVTERDELQWLRSRLAVMTVEEAWPYVTQVTFGRGEEEILGHYVALCRSSKNKDAAGLGSLAYAFSEGDHSVLNGNAGDWFIRVVAKAIGARDRYWEWIEAECRHRDDDAQRLAVRALEASKKAGWAWDKSFAYAAALFAAKAPIPPLDHVASDKPNEFPYWVAIDKHTPKGKEAIREAAAELKIPANTALWVSFYLESGVCSNAAPSPWWERERHWRLAKLKLSEGEAEAMWVMLKRKVVERLAPEAEKLAQQIKDYIAPIEATNPESKVPNQAQRSLFG